MRKLIFISILHAQAYIYISILHAQAYIYR